MERRNIVEISVVVPLYNEEFNIHEFYNRLTNSVKSITENYELLFVKDGSADNTLKELKNYGNNDGHVKHISFSRNFRH